LGFHTEHGLRLHNIFVFGAHGLIFFRRERIFERTGRYKHKAMTEFEFVDLEIGFEFAGFAKRESILPSQCQYASATGLLKPAKSTRTMGLSIATARISQRLSQKDLAQTLNVKVAQVQRWESSAQDPTGEQLTKLRSVLKETLE
jgi:DNA-binding transcriptional regulator YiaG